MKKKLFEKDIFYLSLFICICLVAVGGIWFTNNNVNKLTANNESQTNDDEIHLIDNNDKEKDNLVPTATEPEEDLETAKQKEETNKTESKLNYVGKEVLKSYSENKPVYSKTLDIWEVHKGVDLSANEDKKVKSILDGKVSDVYSDDKYGNCVKVTYSDDLTVIYSSLSKDIQVSKGDKVTEGQCLGYASDTSAVENADGVHVHLEAYKNNSAINPLSLLE